MSEETEEVEEVSEEVPEEPEPKTKKSRRSFDKVVDEVRRGEWGVGQDRRLRLAQAGFDHREIQAELVRRANAK